VGALPSGERRLASKAVTLFGQFLTLADYAELRTGRRRKRRPDRRLCERRSTFTEPLTSQDSNKDAGGVWPTYRRDPQVIRDVARYFHLVQEQTVGPNRQVKAVGDFANNRGVRRIWQALQLLQVVGIPVDSLAAAAAVIAPTPPVGSPTPDVVAANMKNAVKARCTPDTWRPIAQSVFDKLRQRKRDALVAFLVNALALENAEQLFEYFLVDQGMEPVVPTSRLRLALYSVQTFIQRCLLNLENGNSAQSQRNVAPAAIDADLWAWMKRYRVWEANRKIFLFPENWMEPELRLDKTDLFQTLEGALLQGDARACGRRVPDLPEGPDVRARLTSSPLHRPGQDIRASAPCTCWRALRHAAQVLSHLRQSVLVRLGDVTPTSKATT
jgi:hypothetical protein